MIGGIPTNPAAGGMGGGMNIGSIGGIGGSGGGLSLPGTDPAEQAGGTGFGDLLKKIVIDNPTQAQGKADALASATALGKNAEPHEMAAAQAMAGIEIQIATRTIANGVTALRTLMQMQI